MRSTEITKGNYRKTCETVLARLIPEVDKYQPGKTKIFFRAGQVSDRKSRYSLTKFLHKPSLKGY